MTLGDSASMVDPRALAAALQAAMVPPAQDGAYRAVLSEVRAAIPFAFGAVLRLRGNVAEVVGVYPAAMAGIEAGVSWAPLDGPERNLLASGEPSLDGNVRSEVGDASPLSRLPGFGMRSVLRTPLFAGNEIVGSVLLYAYGINAFSARDGIGLEHYVRALGPRLSGSAGSPSGREVPSTDAIPAVPPPPAPPAMPPPPPTGAEPSHVPPPRQVDPAPPSVHPLPPDVAEPAAGVPGPVAEEQPIAPQRISIQPQPAEPSPSAEPPLAQRPPAPAEDAAPERLSVLGELVSGVAHELNNPLTTILGYAQLLPTLDGDELRRAITTIEQEAQRAGRIVRNLLYFARQHRPRVEPVDLNTVLARVVEVRRYNLEANGVHIETRFGEVPELLGDQYQLEQVFLNLVNNAQQALQPGGGTITVASEAIGDIARVSVTDTGPGVPEELMQRIFEPFFTTREVGEGSGLGLSIAYGIVHSHGGRLLTERAPGGGARFVVELPLPPEPVAPPVSAPRDTRGSGERVLVVEDESSVRSLISTILGTSGYAVLTAESGTQAVEALEHGQFDLVISDVRMPGLDGEGLYEQVQARWPRLMRRLLFISGDIEADRFAARLREQDIRYLEKPFTARDLLAAARDVLSQAAQS